VGKTRSGKEPFEKRKGQSVTLDFFFRGKKKKEKKKKRTLKQTEERIEDSIGREGNKKGRRKNVSKGRERFQIWGFKIAPVQRNEGGAGMVKGSYLLISKESRQNNGEEIDRRTNGLHLGVKWGTNSGGLQTKENELRKPKLEGGSRSNKEN